MLANLNGFHLVLVLAVILLLFGAAKLPALARSVGQSARIFRREVAPEKADAETEADNHARVGDGAIASRSPRE